MAVITVSREKGSAGRAIAQQAAQLLGYHFVDRTTMQRLLEQYGVIEFPDEYDTMANFWTPFTNRGERRDVMMEMLRRATFALARHGNVVMLGRGCYALLQDFADVVNMKVQAPLALRVKRVMEREKIADLETATAFVKETDQVRASFVKACYNASLDESSMFDLVVNTGKVAPDMAINWLVETTRSIERNVAGEEATTQSIKIDSVLALAVSKELECSVAHW